MRVCPLCEFIYEDDQGVCDMDGTALVYDPAPLGLAQVAESQSPTHLAPTHSARSRLKRFAATAVTGVVLGTVLVLVFYAFLLKKQEQFFADSPRAANYSSPQISNDSAAPPIMDLSLPVPLVFPVRALPIPRPTIDQTATPMDVPPSPTRVPRATSNFMPGPTARSTTGGGVARPRSQPAAVTARPSPTTLRPPTKKSEESGTGERAEIQPIEKRRNESRIGSFLRKTGRILKKPFS